MYRVRNVAAIRIRWRNNLDAERNHYTSKRPGGYRSGAFRNAGHKLSVNEVDKNQMLAKRRTSGEIPASGAKAKILSVALELLTGCGMISRATSRACYQGDAGHHTLSSTVHYSLVNFCNRLEPFRRVSRLNVLTVS